MTVGQLPGDVRAAVPAPAAALVLGTSLWQDAWKRLRKNREDTADLTQEIFERFLRKRNDLNPSFIFAKERSGTFTLANHALAVAYGTTVDGLIGGDTFGSSSSRSKEPIPEKPDNRHSNTTCRATQPYRQNLEFFSTGRTACIRTCVASFQKQFTKDGFVLLRKLPASAF